MAMGTRVRGGQGLFLASSEIRALDRLLEGNGIDEFAGETCREVHAGEAGLVGYSAWRVSACGWWNAWRGIGAERAMRGAGPGLDFAA